MHKNLKKLTSSQNNKLLSIYSTISNFQEIINAVKEAEKVFIEDVRLCGLAKYGLHTSAVHGFEDVRVQAFIVAIPANNYEEMIMKAYMAFGTHLLDDFFDRPDLPPSPSDMKIKRGNIKELLFTIKALDKFTLLMSEKAVVKEAFFKGIHRLMYGGLIPLAETYEEQDMYLHEYKEISKKHLDDNIKKEIDKIRNIPFWMTTKTIQELLWSPEPSINLSLTELWSIIYAPALYLHNFKEEQETGELNFHNKELPKVDEMQAMLKVGMVNIPKYKERLSVRRIEQLSFLTKAFSKLFPDEIKKDYEELIKSLKSIPRTDL
jgi:hypothetical protein